MAVNKKAMAEIDQAMADIDTGYRKLKRELERSSQSVERVVRPEVIVNHKEAIQLAYLRQDKSNLARCYIDLYEKLFW